MKARRVTANLPEDLLKDAMDGGRGLAVSTPDAHVAQCALDRDAVLLSGDAVFTRMAAVAKLRVRPLVTSTKEA